MYSILTVKKVIFKTKTIELMMRHKYCSCVDVCMQSYQSRVQLCRRVYAELSVKSSAVQTCVCRVISQEFSSVDVCMQSYQSRVQLCRRVYAELSVKSQVSARFPEFLTCLARPPRKMAANNYCRRDANELINNKKLTHTQKICEIILSLLHSEKFKF